MTSDAPIPTLSTERLILRPWREEDLPAFAALNADPRVVEFLPKRLERAESDALAARIGRDIPFKYNDLYVLVAPVLDEFVGKEQAPQTTACDDDAHPDLFFYVSYEPTILCRSIT